MGPPRRGRAAARTCSSARSTSPLRASVSLRGDSASRCAPRSRSRAAWGAAEQRSRPVCGSPPRCLRARPASTSSSPGASSSRATPTTRAPLCSAVARSRCRFQAESCASSARTCIPISPSLSPSQGLPTPIARAALPAQVPFRDAVENPRRLALLLEGLRRADPELLALGGEDRLHVPYRLPLIPGAAKALVAAREAGAWLATISGSGSGLIAIGARGRVESISVAMVDALRAVDSRAEGRVAELVQPGPDYPRANP